MISNRKARLLLRVPAARVGDVSYYVVSNSRILFVVGSMSGIEVRNRTRAEKRRAAAYRRHRDEDQAKWLKLGIAVDPAQYTGRRHVKRFA